MNRIMSRLRVRIAATPESGRLQCEESSPFDSTHAVGERSVSEALLRFTPARLSWLARLGSAITVLFNTIPPRAAATKRKRGQLRSSFAMILFAAAVESAGAQSFTENFDDISTLAGNGWLMQNNSSPIGTTNWFQGKDVAGGGPFDAYNGAADAYIAANFNNTTGGTGTISDWLVMPNRIFRNGDVLSFYTRTISPENYPDRLEVRLSANGASTNVGTSATAVGDFATLLLSIDPSLITGVYPTSWAQYTITISGLSAPTSGRAAFRYVSANFSHIHDSHHTCENLPQAISATPCTCRIVVERTDVRPSPLERDMSEERGSNPIRGWHKMSSREQAVWCASYAAQLDKEASALSRALTADRIVTQLRALDVDRYPFEPEQELWRSGLNIRYEDFAPWYRVALRMMRVGRGGVDAYQKVTDEECKEAYNRYEMSAGDFS